ncbi:MAG TPA: hypothetical protein VGM88_24300 [Kofleriaceae bacterium]|jgi:hypothetical protein
MRAILFLMLASCIGSAGDPMLRGAPRPSTGGMAAAAAGIAGAATLAAPDAAARNNAETRKAYDRQNVKGVTVKETVPGDVLDRADAQKQQAAAPVAAPAAPVANGSAAPAPGKIDLFPKPGD